MHQFQINHYLPIRETCIDICDEALAISKKPAPTSVHLYASLCIKLTEEIQEELDRNNATLVPYVKQLHEKEQTGHNCLSCSGGCKVKHMQQVFTIREAQQKIKEIIYRLGQLSHPVNEKGVEQMAQQEKLQKNIQLLDNQITEIFYLEEAILIPKILDAQNNINAVN
ncbi:hypothetical protein [Taibaiella soli]|nr:hypothetical protein [Taibaiella soli]